MRLHRYNNARIRMGVCVARSYSITLYHRENIAHGLEVDVLYTQTSIHASISIRNNGIIEC